MPHSVTPDPTETPDDVVLPDAPAAAADAASSSDSESAPGSVKDEALAGENKENAGLDDMFDDDDEEDEFSSSNPQSSAAPAAQMYVSLRFEEAPVDILQIKGTVRQILRSRNYASILPTTVSFPIPLPMAKSLTITD